MTFRWRTDPASVGVVHFGPSAGNLAGTVSETNSVTDHEITVTGLTPNTQYYYSVGTPTGSLQGDNTNYFYTFPIEGTPKKTRIWALGDFGYFNSTRQSSVKNAFKNYVQSIGDPNIDLWLWLGDNAYNSGLDSEYQSNTFDTNSGYGGDRFMKQTPIFATPGNHDYANNNDLRVSLAVPYYQVVSHPTNGESGGVPSGTESYYSFTYGNIHFVSLDSDRYEDNTDRTSNVRFIESKPQITWLKQDLTAAQNNPNIKWIIAFWHEPPYTKGTHDSDTEKGLIDVRMNLLPVLEKYKVDLVMCGHSHVYERSRLMKGHYGDSMTFTTAVNNPADGSNAKANGKFDGSANSCYYFKSRSATTNEGTVYVTNGAGGAPGGHITSGISQWPHKAMEVSYDNPLGGSMYLEIEGGKLVAKMIAGDGSIQDQFTIIKDADSFAIPATATNSLNATCECTDAGNNQTHYTDNNLNKLLSIKKNGQAIGTVGDGTFNLQLKSNTGASFIAKNSPANYVSLPTGWYGSNRYFTITPTSEPAAGNTMAVSFYYTQADLASINNGIGQTLTPEQLKVFKVNDVSTIFNGDPASGQTTIPRAYSAGANGATIFSHSAAGSSVANWKNTALGGGAYQADFQVAHLGSGGIGGALNGANPTAGTAVICDNLFAGTSAGLFNTTGCCNVALGPKALLSNQVGRSNVAVGDSAGFNNLVTGNTFVGAKAGFANTTGTQATFLGDSAGFRNNGQANTFIGYRTGMNTTTGSLNTFLGVQAGLNNTTGSNNFFLGVNAGVNNTSGSENFFIGENAGGTNTIGGSNVYLGSNSGNGAGVDGSNNIAIGIESGRANQRGNNNTFLGFQADAGAIGLHNATAIGTNARVNMSNSVVLGNNANVGIGTSNPNNKLEINTGTRGRSGLRLAQVTSEMPVPENATKFLTVNAQGDVYLANYLAEAQPAVVSRESLWKRNGSFLQSANNESILIGQGMSRTSSDYNLFVSKGIMTEKLNVSVKNPADWSDYVLEKSHKLQSLADVEHYIQQHQHLPGIPSAEEVAKDGIDVAKMNAKLLEKIEELTLYVIDLKKEVELLKQPKGQKVGKNKAKKR